MEEKYKDLIYGSIRSISASFPAFASLAQAWSEIETHLYKKRVEEFFLHFQKELSNVNEKLQELDTRNNTDELIELLQKCVSLSKETSNPEKRKLFPKILTNIIVNTENLNHETKLNFIESLDYLSITDIQVLSFFKIEQSIRVDNILRQSRIKRNDREKLSLLITSLTKLESRGLISVSANPGTEVYGGSGAPDHWTNQWKDKYYEILPNGVDFFNTIK